MSVMRIVMEIKLLFMKIGGLLN